MQAKLGVLGSKLPGQIARSNSASFRLREAMNGREFASRRLFGLARRLGLLNLLPDFIKRGYDVGGSDATLAEVQRDDGLRRAVAEPMDEGGTAGLPSAGQGLLLLDHTLGIHGGQLPFLDRMEQLWL